MAATVVKDGVDLTAQTAALASTLATSPVSSLVGVTDDAAKALKKLGVVTIFDLAHAQAFVTAAEIAGVVDGTNQTLSRARRIPDSWVVEGLRGEEPERIAASPAEQLASIDGLLTHAQLVDSLGVSTIADLAHWPAFVAARALLASALGIPAEGQDHRDPGTPADLLPANGVYPTEVFYYDRLYLDEILGKPAARKDLVKAGRLSIADAAAKTTGFDTPAVGAQVTIEQSWHVLGLTLGQLLHAVALAPGESVRLAMVDWSRRTAGSRDEAGSEDEALTNETQHNRAISEVAAAVATETQSGGSTTIGSAKTEQGGVSGGIGPVGGTYSQGGTSSFGQVWSTSSGTRNVAAQSSQSVAESTQQAAAAVRNRRATVVQEVEESESSTVTTRVVANYNHMHALNVQYYETIQVFSVKTQVARVRRCLFVPIALEEFDELPGGRDAAIVAGATDDLDLRHWLEVLASGVRLAYPNPPVPPEEEDPAPVVWDDTIVDAARELPVALPGARVRGDEVAVPETAVITEIAAPSLRAGDRFTAELRDGRRVTATVRGGRARFAGNVSLASMRELSLDSSSTAPMGSIDIAIEDEQGNRAVLRNRSGLEAKVVSSPLMMSKDPLTPAQRDAALAKLKSNRLRYNQAIWAAMDQATLALLLSDFDFEGRSVLEQIDPTPIAVAGNYLVFRMSTEPDGAYASAQPARAPSTPEELWHEWLVNHGLDQQNLETQTVALPSGGVFAEAVLGRANSAELLDITRFWNWQDSPIPLQPTEILPPSTESRQGAVDLKPGEFSNPMVNIVAPTALPDPTGMSGILAAVSRGDMFRDMSGMDLAAGIARAALDASTSAAGSAGQISAENFAEMNRHKEAIFDRFLQLYGKGAVGGTAPGDRNISTAGAALNYGRGMDEAASGAAQGAANATEADSNGAGAVGGNGASGAVDGGATSSGTAEEAAFSSVIGGGSGGGGGGPGGGRIGANFFRMFGSMAAGGLMQDKVVKALLDNAKKYKLTLTKPGAEAIYEEISWLDLPKLDSKDTPDSEKLKILRKATEAAIKETKDAAVKNELEQVIKDVDKALAADAGTPQ